MKINFNMPDLQRYTNINKDNKKISNYSTSFGNSNFDSFTKRVKENGMLSNSKPETKWDLDDFISRYNNEKDRIREEIVIPAIKLKAGINAEIANGVFLFGDSKIDKALFSEAVANEINAHHTVLIPNNFIQDVSEELKKARERYLKTGERTVVLLLNTENYLKEAPENKGNIEQMKKWLEHSAEIPSDENPNAYATTFFVSNNKLGISNELMYTNPLLQI